MKTALEILQEDQPGKPWKAFAPRARALADAIACSWADNDGPVHLRGPLIPVDMERMLVEIPKETKSVRGLHVRDGAISLKRVLDIVRTIPKQGATSMEIAARLSADKFRVNDRLNELRRLGLAVQLGARGSRDARWRAA